MDIEVCINLKFDLEPGMGIEDVRELLGDYIASVCYDHELVSQLNDIEVNEVRE